MLSSIVEVQAHAWVMVVNCGLCLLSLLKSHLLLLLFRCSDLLDELLVHLVQLGVQTTIGRVLTVLLGEARLSCFWLLQLWLV